MKEKEYKDNVFIITLPEGGELVDMKVPAFNGFAMTGDINPKRQIRFYAKVIGFEDIRAPSRNWDYSLKNFIEGSWSSVTINSLKNTLKKIL